MQMSATAFQRRRREEAARLAALQSEQTEVEAEGITGDEDKTPDINDLTKNEIMSKLDELNVEYNPRDNKETLKGLLVDAIS